MTGGGSLLFHLRGGRDPYAISGHAAGFVKAWRGDVRLLFGMANKDYEFFQIESREYVLGVPDLESFVDAAATGLPPANSNYLDDDRSVNTSLPNSDYHPGSGRLAPDLKMVKTVAKLVDGVKWGMGIRLERTCHDDTSCRHTPRCKGSVFDRSCRFFDFKPHYEVQTRTREGMGEVRPFFNVKYITT